MRIHSVVRLVVVTACLLSLASSLKAQEIRKTLHDYWLDRPFTYQPSDPFVRSKLYRLQTGHAGMFYNCDDEECKRNSPYICWKTHWEKDLPTTMTCLQRIRHEADQVRQRVIDGAGMCAGNATCGCNDCASRRNRVPGYAATDSRQARETRVVTSCPQCEGKSAQSSQPAVGVAALQARIRETPQPLRSLTRSTSPKADAPSIYRQENGLFSGQPATSQVPVIEVPAPRAGLVNRLANVRGDETPPAPIAGSRTLRR